MILLSSAQNIYDAGVGIVYLCSIFPGLLIKLTSPLWLHSGALGHVGKLLYEENLFILIIERKRII